MNIIRESSNQTLFETGAIDDAIIYEKNKISGLIRIEKNDFVYLKDMNFLTHFNLQYTDHKVGEYYCLVKILKKGKFTSKNEILPLLTKSGFLAECIEVKNNVLYQNIDFSFSFPTIKSIEELKKAISKRYSKSMPEIKNLLSLGVGITKLKIIKPVKLVLK